MADFSDPVSPGKADLEPGMYGGGGLTVDSVLPLVSSVGFACSESTALAMLKELLDV